MILIIIPSSHLAIKHNANEEEKQIVYRLQSKERWTPFYNNGCPYSPLGLFGQLFHWLQKFGAHLKTIITVTYNSV